MSKRIKVVSFKLQEHELIELDRYAERRGLSRSEVIREALNKLIKGGFEDDGKDDEYLSVDLSRKRVSYSTQRNSDTSNQNNNVNGDLKKHIIFIDCCLDQEN